MSDRFQQLERDVALFREESNKAQAEVDRLLEILKEMENEKNDKDKKIAELERWDSYNVFGEHHVRAGISYSTSEVLNTLCGKFFYSVP